MTHAGKAVCTTSLLINGMLWLDENIGVRVRYNVTFNTAYQPTMECTS